MARVFQVPVGDTTLENMWLLDRLAEQHIRDAAERGAFDDLPGTGRPLRLEDDQMVPEELRAGYRLLKNSGHLPPELELKRELRSVEQLLDRSEHGTPEHSRARKRLNLLQAQLGETRLGATLLARSGYQDRLMSRLAGDD